MNFIWILLFAGTFIIPLIVLFIADMIFCHIQDFFRSIKFKRTKSYSNAFLSET